MAVLEVDTLSGRCHSCGSIAEHLSVTVANENFGEFSLRLLYLRNVLLFCRHEQLA